MNSTISETYRKTPAGDLKIHYFEPKEDVSCGECRNHPAIILFFGGGWRSGSPEHFTAQLPFLRSLGLAVFLPEYRIREKHQSTPFDSLDDACVALEWLFSNVERFNIASDRIVCGGASAGGHLAIMSTLKSGFKNKIQSLVLYNPVVDTNQQDGCGYETLKDRYLELSPIEHIEPNMPCSLILHGDQDTIVKPHVILRFIAKMQEMNNVCELAMFPGFIHGFEDSIYKREPFEKAVEASNEKIADFLKRKEIVL